MGLPEAEAGSVACRRPLHHDSEWLTSVLARDAPEHVRYRVPGGKRKHSLALHRQRDRHAHPGPVPRRGQPVVGRLRAPGRYHVQGPPLPPRRCSAQPVARQPAPGRVPRAGRLLPGACTPEQRREAPQAAGRDGKAGGHGAVGSRRSRGVAERKRAPQRDRRGTEGSPWILSTLWRRCSGNNSLVSGVGHAPAVQGIDRATGTPRGLPRGHRGHRGQLAAHLPPPSAVGGAVGWKRPAGWQAALRPPPWHRAAAAHKDVRVGRGLV